MPKANRHDCQARDSKRSRIRVARRLAIQHKLSFAYMASIR
jgi:hypothetical protein